jgi:branched-chain amino acid aminotransferase
MVESNSHPETRDVTSDETGGNPVWERGAAFVDGEFCPVEDAKISVLDLGVTRSDCTYDVVHVWEGRFFRLDAHLDRFAANLRRLRLDSGLDRAAIEHVLHGCVRRAGLRCAYVSMTCTRGRLPQGSRDLRTARNTFYAYALPFVWIATLEQQTTTGVGMWISDIPRIPPDSVDPLVKNYHWLDMDMALLGAYEHDVQLVVLRDREGGVAEGPGFNVFALVDGGWRTPASGTLHGVTRRTAIELLREGGARVEEGPLPAADLRRAEEVLVTSTAGGVIPVTAVDGSPVGTGGPGERTLDLHERYWARHADPAYSTPVRYDG